MKKIVTTLVFVISGLAFSQVGINAGKTSEGDPHNLADDAVLHVENATGQHKGVLLPSVALTSDTDQTTTSGGSVSTGLMVWNDGTAALKPAGYYYWNGSKWILTGNVDDKVSFKKFVLTANGQTAPKGTTLIIASGNIDPVRLPKMEAEEAGTIIMVHKNDSNNITVQDYQGLVAGEIGAVIKGVSSVKANRGSTFIWTGEYWMSTNY